MSCAPDCGHAAASCCEGQDVLVPEAKDIPPGQSSLRYRVGTYASFYESMLARLMTRPELPQACDPQGEGGTEREPDPFGLEADGRLRWPLRALTVREQDDPTIALLDAWAMVGDVLTFYQERIANEGYLRTATEARSLEALAQLVGYRPRPGVAASVDLAFTLEPGQTVEIPAGTRAQSMPEPGALPQAYETKEPLVATADRGEMRPLQAKFRAPEVIAPLRQEQYVYLEGTNTNLEANDLVLVFESGASPGVDELFRVDEVEPMLDVKKTRVRLRTYPDRSISVSEEQPVELVDSEVAALVRSLTGQPEDVADDEWPPQLALRRDLLPTDRDVLDMVGGDRRLRESFKRALETLKASRAAPIELHVLRGSSPLFGYNGTARYFDIGTNEPAEWPVPADEAAHRLFIDTPNERVRPGSYVVVERWDAPPCPETPSDDGEVDGPGVGLERPDDIITLMSSVGEGDFVSLSVHEVSTASIHPRAAYGLAKTTLELMLRSGIPWESPATIGERLCWIRSLMVHLESEALEVARAPLPLPLEGDLLDLEGLYFDLEPGRLLIVEGEDASAPGTRFAERVVVASVAHDLEEVSTQVTTTEPLQRSYARKSTIIHGNVARATQGESRTEVLGSGDASKPSQAFTLRHAPLTHVAAATIDGVQSTLTVRVNGVVWPEARIPMLLGPNDRRIFTHVDEQGRTVVVGGDGRHGARFPTGQDNIVAEYRSGQGAAGNVDAGRISMLVTRPFGVQKVINPLPASDGADRDGVEAMRVRIPLSVVAFDRLVSVQDHVDFALAFGGIAKASARRVGTGTVHAAWRVRTVVAGIEPVALEVGSELLVALLGSMQSHGDPALEREVVPATLEPLTIRATVAVAPGYAWSEVEPRLRAALIEWLGYDVQGIGQAIQPSRIVAILQEVPGVDFIDLDAIEIAGTSGDDPLIYGPGAVIPPNPDAVRFVDAALPENLDLREWKP